MTLIFDTIQISNPTGTKTLDLPITSVDPSSAYILKDVMGLGPPDINVAMLQTLSGNGIHQLSQVLSREIVMRIRLNPDFSVDQTVADLRTNLYGFISVGKDIFPNFIRLLNGVTTVVEVPVYLKKFEIVPFAKEPEVQLTFACKDAFLKDPVLAEVDTGTLSTSNPQITNSGTAPTGFYMNLTFSSSSMYFSIYFTDEPNKIMTINYDFAANDILTIDTRPGFRYVGCTRGGVESNLYNGLDGESTWLTLESGTNDFTVSPTTFDWNDVHFNPQYWGI